MRKNKPEKVGFAVDPSENQTRWPATRSGDANQIKTKREHEVYKRKKTSAPIQAQIGISRLTCMPLYANYFLLKVLQVGEALFYPSLPFRGRLPTYLASREGESGLARSSIFSLSIYEEDTHTNDKNRAANNKKHSRRKRNVSHGCQNRCRGGRRYWQRYYL